MRLTARQRLALALALAALVWTSMLPKAGALTACPPGQVAYGAGVEYCIDPPTGNVTSPSGTPAVSPRPLQEPASVETAVQGSGETLAEKVGSVMEDSAAADGSVAVTSEAIPGAGQIVGSGFLGFQIGQTAAQLSCSAGIGALCIPPKSPAFVPNTDVTVSDPGWRNGVQQWTSYGGSVRHIDVIAPAPTAGTAGHVTFQITLVSGATGYADGFQAYDVNGSTTGCQSGNFNVQSSITITCGAGANVPGYVAFQSNGNTTAASAMPLYWLPGYSARPPAQSGNPVRSWQTTNTCAKLDGSGNVTTTASGQSFYETDATLPAFPVAPNCPAGSQLAGTTVVEITPNLPNKTVWQYNVPAPVLAARQNYPQCVGTVCKLGLWKIGTGGQLANCFLASTSCGSWFSDPSKTSDYDCTYGPTGTATDQVVALTECNAYAPTFDPQKQQAGVPYADPATGQSPDTLATPTGTPAPSDQSCWPSGWTAVMEPASWFLQPMKCALLWAFQPDSSTITSLKTRISTDVSGSGIGPWVTALGAVFNHGGGSGCQGPEVDFPGTDPPTQLFPFSACDEPMATAATISRAMTTVVTIAAGGFACLRSIQAGFGYHDD